MGIRSRAQVLREKRSERHAVKAELARIWRVQERPDQALWIAWVRQTADRRRPADGCGRADDCQRTGQQERCAADDHRHKKLKEMPGG